MAIADDFSFEYVDRKIEYSVDPKYSASDMLFFLQHDGKRTLDGLNSRQKSIWMTLSQWGQIDFEVSQEDLDAIEAVTGDKFVKDVT